MNRPTKASLGQSTTTSSDAHEDVGVAAYLARPGLLLALDALRARYRDLGRVIASVTVVPVSDEQADDLRRLLRTAQVRGRRRITVGEPITVKTAWLERAFAAAGRANLTVSDALQRTGPVDGRAAERTRLALAEGERREQAFAHPAASNARTAAWLDALDRGVWRDKSETEALLQALTAICALSMNTGPRTLAGFSTDVLDDAHALQRSQPAGRLFRRFLAFDAGVDLPGTRQAERELYERYDLLPGGLSSTALVAGLRVSGDGYLARSLRDAADAGEARAVTLRELSRHPLDPGQLTEVWILENESILEETLDELGSSLPAVICLQGQFSVATATLLKALDRPEVLVHARCDFDTGGLRIARRLAETVVKAQLVPWRFDAATYATLTGHTPSSTPNGLRPETARTRLVADDLVEAIQTGRPVHEEALSEVLCADLVAAAARR